MVVGFSITLDEVDDVASYFARRLSIVASVEDASVVDDDVDATALDADVVEAAVATAAAVVPDTAPPTVVAAVSWLNEEL